MSPNEITQWRTTQRAALIAKRLGIPISEHQQWSGAITQWLTQGFPLLNSMIVGIYWPFKAEFDPRFAAHHFRTGGATTALPVVVQKGAPLQFREWRPGVSTSKGVFGLPVPEGTAMVSPQAVLVPPVGFDLMGYRLGYGGGYFDRTFAAMQPQPLKIGVAFELSRLETIHPQSYDVPMDFMVSERGIYKTTVGGLVYLNDPTEANACCLTVLQQRNGVIALHT